MPQSAFQILGIDPDNPRPTAYDIIGVPSGESDATAIEQAFRKTAAKLNAVRADCEPQSWAQAAKALKSARAMLIDAGSKVEHDAKLATGSGRGIQSTTGKLMAVAGRQRGEAEHDPLRGLVPTVDPLAPFDMDAAAKRASLLQPPPLPKADAVDQPEDDHPDDGSFEVEGTGETRQILGRDSDQPEAAVPDFVTAENPSLGTPLVRRIKRRRRFPVASVLLGLFVIGMLGGVAWLVHELVSREESRSTQSQVAMAGGTRQEDAAQDVGRPRERETRAVDPVMGGLGGGVEPPQSKKNPVFEEEFPSMPAQDLPADASASAPEMEAPMAGDSPEMVEVNNEPSSPDDAMMPEKEVPSAANEAAGEAALKAAGDSILKSEWEQMKRLCEVAVEAAANERQTENAKRLFAVADLADYYHIGLKKALSELQSGNSFMLTDQIEVNVVEAGPDQIVLQVGGRPRTYLFAEMPFILVHRLGEFSMSKDDPFVVAAKAVFQTIYPKAIEQDRKQARDWLLELPEEVNDVRPHEVAETLQKLYP